MKRISQQYYWRKQLENVDIQIRLAQKRVDLNYITIFLVIISMSLQIILFLLR